MRASKTAEALPRVSLLLPNRNNEPALDIVLERLATNTTYPDFELIAVDDGSTDASRDVLRRWRDSGRFDRFTLLECEHRGVVATLNTALEHASGEIMVQLDADASIETRGWLERMVGFYRSDERIGVVCGRVIMDDGRIHAYGLNVVGPDGMHDRGTKIAEPAGARTLHSVVERPRETEVRHLERYAEVDAALGCCMMYSKDLAQQIGGYDLEWSPVWFDDMDIALSARRFGKKVFFCPEVRVLHRLSLRNSRAAGSPAARARTRARRALGRVVPQAGKDLIIRAAKLNKMPPDKVALLDHHYAYWREKWGFDALNPDMDSVLSRWGDTEVCWAFDAERRHAGEEIIAAYERELAVG